MLLNSTSGSKRNPANAGLLSHTHFCKLLARRRQASSFDISAAASPFRDLAISCVCSRGNNQSFTSISTFLERNTNYTSSHCNFTFFKVFTTQLVQRRLQGLSSAIRQSTFISINGSDIRLNTRSSFETLSQLRTGDVVLVSRQGDGGQNTDNGDYDHQFDQGETFLDCFHVLSPDKNTAPV